MATTTLLGSNAATPLGGGGQSTTLSIYKVSGIFVGTLTFEATFDGGASYDPIAATPVAGGAVVTTTTGNGAWRIASSGADGCRARFSAYTSGAAVVRDTHVGATL